MEYVIIAVLVVIVIFALIESFYSKKLFVKKLAADNAYIKLDDLFIERYEMMPALFNGEDEKISAIMIERQQCIDSKTEIERSKHDKKMCELIFQYVSDKNINISSLDDVTKRIEEAYFQYNELTNDFNAFLTKPLVRPIGKFLGFSQKPIL